MSIRSGFFNAVKNGLDGSYDRKYYASEFAGYFASFIGNGIFGKQLDEFKVKAKINPDMGVVVSPGRAWINGYWIESTEEVELPISVNTSTSERVDLVVLGLNLNTREISIYVKNGNSTNGVIRDESTYELCIAKINVSPTTVNIQQTNIADQRQNYELCGYAELLINHDIDELTNFIKEYVNRANSDYLVWLNVIQGLVDQLKGLISEDAAGALQIQINKLRDTKLDKVSSSEELPEGFVYQQEGGATKLIPMREIVSKDIVVVEKRLYDSSITKYDDNKESVVCEFTKQDFINTGLNYYAPYRILNFIVIRNYNARDRYTGEVETDLKEIIRQQVSNHEILTLGIGEIVPALEVTSKPLSGTEDSEKITTRVGAEWDSYEGQTTESVSIMLYVLKEN